ncbi:MAG: DsrE/DsrF/DrsH-like family protein [Chloroflexi bacterium]|nr:DsrE/DsrF/DrsH-like family protein [Chloroflexota bacterium]
MASKEAKEKVVLILNTASYERVAYALNLAAVSAALDREVLVLFGPGALARLKKDGQDEIGEETNAWVRESVKARLNKDSIAPVSESLQLLSSLGGRIYACPSAMALHNLTRDELVDEVTQVCGLAQFLEEATGASMTLYV